MAETPAPLATDRPIVFYDGVCGLCDRAVQTLVRLDRQGRLQFATLQGETARNRLGPTEGPAENWSLTLVDARGCHDRSTAVLRAIAHTGRYRGLARLALAIPRPIRDAVYRFVARNRYRWFGQRDACALPSPDLRARFLP